MEYQRRIQIFVAKGSLYDDIQVVTKSLILKTLQPPFFLTFPTLFSFPYLILSFPHSIPHSRFT